MIVTEPTLAIPRGGIDVICGCMFAGKTTRLIQRLESARAAGRRIVAVKHALDVRYAARQLATHDGLRFDAIALRTADALPALAEGGAEVVGIDESQFFGEALAAACDALARAGMEVIIAGIDHDAWGRPFAPMPQLIALARKVEVLCAPCAGCGAAARYSQRMTPVIGGDMVGGPGDYEPRCAACFSPLPAAPVRIPDSPPQARIHSAR